MTSSSVATMWTVSTVTKISLKDESMYHPVLRELNMIGGETSTSTSKKKRSPISPLDLLHYLLEKEILSEASLRSSYREILDSTYQKSSSSSTTKGGGGGEWWDRSHRSHHSSEDADSSTASGTANSSQNNRTAAISIREKKMNQKLEDFAVKSLNLNKLGIYGRDDEIQILERELKNICGHKDATSTNKRAMILIEGPSGAGKTTLARYLERPTLVLAKGLFVSARFDFQKVDEPLFGIKSALCQLCDGIISQNNNQLLLENIKKKLVSELGPSEIKLLTSIIHNLVDVVGEDMVLGSIDNNNDDMELKEYSKRLNFTIRQFMNIICSYAPVVLLCDDIQWADKESLSLVESWVTDVENPSMMVIGTCRSISDDGEEKEEECEVDKLFQRVKEIGEERSIAAHKIILGDLTVDDVNRIIADLLSISDDDGSTTKDLADIVYQKTNGNSFFVIQYMVSLTQQNLLSYNVGLMKWDWDETVIQAKSTATDNVADLMKEKLQQIPAAGKILPWAACLGSAFTYDVICIVMDELNDSSRGTLSNLSDALQQLAQCEEEGLIECFGNKKQYRFIHGKVQEAALGLLSAEELEKMQFRIGDVLLSRLTPETLEDLLFVVANLLGTRAEFLPKGDPTRMRTIELNQKAGIKCIKLSAFETATIYFKRAIKLLPENHFQSNYALSFELFSKAAECELCVGNYDGMKTYCDEALNVEGCPLLDQVATSHILLDGLMAQGRFKECLDQCLAVLDKLGYRFVMGMTSIRTKAGLIRAQRKTIKSIEKLSLSTDVLGTFVAKTLYKVTTSAYFCRPDLLSLACLNCFEWTFKRGVTSYSPAAFASLSFTMACVKGDLERGRLFADQALTILKKLKNKRTEAFSIFLCYSYAIHWYTSWNACMQPLVDGYKSGMSQGDIMNAMWSITTYLDAALYSGTDLMAIDAEFSNYTKQMEDFSLPRHLRVARATWQAVRNLQGASKHNLILSGEIMNQDDELRGCEERGDNLFRAVLHGTQMYLAGYFGNYEFGADLAVTEGDQVLKLRPGGLSSVMITFLNALSCFVMAGRKKDQKYEKLALKLLKKVENWARQGNPNCIHQHAILKAEQAVLHGKTSEAIKHYQTAVLLAGRSGLRHDQALANERLGAFSLSSGDKNEATFRFQEAHRLYDEWGAIGKVRKLESEHQDLLGPPKEISVDISVK